MEAYDKAGCTWLPASRRSAIIEVSNQYVTSCVRIEEDRVMRFVGNEKTAVESAAIVQRITGIEPASPAWEAGVLPMNYIRMKSV